MLRFDDSARQAAMVAATQLSLLTLRRRNLILNPRLAPRQPHQKVQTMTDSYIQIGPGATSFVGPDAISLFRVQVLISALRLHQKTGMLHTRGVSARAMFLHATALTGQTYKRKDHAQAIRDLEVWREGMKAALPIIDAAPAREDGSLPVVDGDENADTYGYAKTAEEAIAVANKYFADPVVAAECYGPIVLANGRLLDKAWVALTAQAVAS